MSAYKHGDHVKVEFTDEGSGESEVMWVEVDYSNDENRLVFGRLESRPIIHTNLIRDHHRFSQS